MNQNWEAAIAFVLAREGGYSNDPQDPGGETNFGISKKAYPNLDIKNLTVDQAKAIYQKDYWQVCKCDELASPFDMATFDCAVNQGTGKAIRLLQIALGIDVDGKVGDKTISATFKVTPGIFRKMMAERIAEYVRLIISKPALNVFSINWVYRVLALYDLGNSSKGV